MLSNVFFAKVVTQLLKMHVCVVTHVPWYCAPLVIQILITIGFSWSIHIKWFSLYSFIIKPPFLFEWIYHRGWYVRKACFIKHFTLHIRTYVLSTRCFSALFHLRLFFSLQNTKFLVTVPKKRDTSHAMTMTMRSLQCRILLEGHIVGCMTQVHHK